MIKYIFHPVTRMKLLKDDVINNNLLSDYYPLPYINRENIMNGV